MQRLVLSGMFLPVLLTLVYLMAANPAWSDDGLSRGEIKQLITREARNIGISPALALAVAKAESDFNPRAESRVGAIGIMQIMPKTARDEYGIPAHLLWNPRVNVRLGLHYLKRLIHAYDGRVAIALSHYNGGSKVNQAGRLRIIPATKAYVRRVLRLQQRFEAQWAGVRDHAWSNLHAR